jgi:hypothetical protein
VLVIRREDHVELRELAPGEYAFLEALSHQASLPVAADRALAADRAFELATALVRVAQLGVLSSFRLLEPS